MANRSLHPLLHYLRRLSGGRSGDSALDDIQLLHRFVTQCDQSAFTTIVRRYGAMVWGLCVRLLGETPEAEDAFQATFLVLVRKAASLRGPQQLGPWLYGVACRTALKLRGQKARRAARETPLPEQIAEERAESIWSDLGPILDEEINRLPTKYRLPVLLCYLQGLSSEEAAQRLGCAKGTIFSRLSRARDLLRRRLVRRGVDVSAGVLTAVLAENAVLRAAPSLALREITIRTSLLFAAGTAGQTLSAPLAALVEGVVRSMILSKVKFVAMIVLAVGIAGAGTGFLGYHTKAGPPSSPSLLPANEENRRVDGLVLANARAPAPAPANPNIPARRNVAHRFRELLNKEIDYTGLEDARATLADAIDQISKRYNLSFHANEQVFHAIDPKIDILRFNIADPAPIPPMSASLGVVLQTILERLPSKMGAMYLIRKEFIEITTEKAVRAELGIPASRPLLPLVWDTLDNVSIAEALRRLADQSGYNVVIDPEAAEKLEKPTTLVEFNNVPIDNAVRLLANMARMSMVRIDNVLYVTTPDNAKHLSEEQAHINADTPTKITRLNADESTNNPTVSSTRITRVNTGFIPSEGKLQWPPVLQREAYREAREGLNVLMKAAYKSVVEGNAPSGTILRDLRSNLRKIQDTLRASVDQLTPDEYIDAERYLRYVERTITALKAANAKPSKKPATEKRAK